MKKVLLGLGILLAVVVVLAVVAPFVVPVETYKAEIEKRVTEATGRKLTIAGPMSLSVLPSLALTASDVTLANAPGASTPNMAQLAKLQVQLQLMPLLSGEIAIDSFVLEKPIINLETDKQGRPNWQFSTASAPQKPAEQSQQQPAQEQPAPGGGALSNLRLGDVRLVDGRVNYRDGQSGKTYTAQAINLNIDLPDLDSPLNADGGLTWNGKPIKLTTTVSKPRAMLEGGVTDLALNLNADLLRLNVKGQANGGEPKKVDGDIDLAVTNVRNLVAWLGQPLGVSGTGLGPLSIKGRLSAVTDAQGARVSFTNAVMSLDKIEAKGELMADTTGRVPSVKAKLDTNLLDLNPYLPPTTKPVSSTTRVPPPGEVSDETVETTQGWSTDPIDFSGLRAVNADLSLTVAGLVFRHINTGKSALHVGLKDGRLAADLTELALYGGNGQGRVTLDGAAKLPAIGLAMKLSGVQASPLLKDSLGFERLSGTLGGDIQINGSGRSQRELVGALGGKGALKFENGAIKGINVAALVRNVSTAFLDAQAGRAQQTDFSELSGTFTIDKGIARNDDLALLAPLLRVNGAGTIDLPRRSLNYRIEPKVVGSLEGQGGGEAGGVMIPVVVQGPWDSLSYKPDLSSLIKDPRGAAESLRGILGGSGQGSQQQPEQPGGEQPNAPANPVDQLRGLFGR